MTNDGPQTPPTADFLFDLEPSGDDRFVGRTPLDRDRRVYGGQVVAQALNAANRTVDGRTAHSLHAYFLLPGDPRLPITYEIIRLRDGKSFSTRQVIARQNGAAIYTMTASYQGGETGLEHQMPMPRVPPPDALLTRDEILSRYGDRLPLPLKRYLTSAGLVDFRMVELERYLVARGVGRREPLQHVWIRFAGKLPEDPVSQQIGLAYLSDFWVLDTTLVAHGRWLGDPDMLPASLDHAVWFHRPCRADQWLLFAQDSPMTIAGRGFGRGLIFQPDGTLVASLAQEGVIRVRRPV